MKKKNWNWSYGEIFVVSVLFTVFFSGTAYGNELIQRRYIEDHAHLAVQQMEIHRIPAFITLVQRILEGTSGTSELAAKANNHFEIKTKSDRSCDSFINSRDKQSCVKYNSVEESYLDHSLFLVERKYYVLLFDLKIDNCAGWAKTLRECGYATDPKYDQKLTSIIQRYKLWKYDNLVLNKSAN